MLNFFFFRKRRGNPHEQQHENGVLLAMPDLNGDLDNFGEETTLSARFSRMLRTVQSCGEYDKLTQGWFENYPVMKIKNAAMEPVSNFNHSYSLLYLLSG